MSVGIRTLTKISHIFCDYETVEGAYKALGENAFYERIHDITVEKQAEYLGDTIEYFLDFCPENFRDNDDWVVGAINPTHLIEEVKHWNAILVSKACEELKNFEEVKKKFGLESMAELFVELENGRTCPGFNYPSSLYRLYHALSNLEGSFLYGIEDMVLEETGNWCEYSIKVSEQTLADVLKCPEDYAIICTYYK